MTGPISPDEALRTHIGQIPEAVFKVFNDLLATRFSTEGGCVTIRQIDVIELLETAGLNRQEIFDKRWLNIEAAYEKRGWKVWYDKPGFNETYGAYWEFSLDQEAR